MRLRDEIGEEKQNQARTPRKAGWLLQIQRQPQRRPPKKKPAAATLRSRTAGSQDESPVGRFTNSKATSKAKQKLPAGRRRYENRYSTQRLKSREALVPPKPKEFESA